jgi:HEAT repeat protein
LSEFLEAVKLLPDFGRARLNAARMLAAKGDSAAAIQQLRQAANSTDAKVRLEAAAALRQIGGQR